MGRSIDYSDRVERARRNQMPFFAFGQTGDEDVSYETHVFVRQRRNAVGEYGCIVLDAVDIRKDLSLHMGGNVIDAYVLIRLQTAQQFPEWKIPLKRKLC